MRSPPSGEGPIGSRWSSGRAERRILSVAFAAAFAASACGTTYQPRPSARVGVVIHHGGAWYVKDGEQFPISALGGTLRPLVADVPAADAHAARARKQFLFGVPLYVGGIASVVVGVALGWTPVGWLVLGAGVGSGATGLGLMGAGVTNTVDAINIHNDSVSGAAPSAR